MCVALPSLRLVRRRFPSAAVTLLTNFPVTPAAAAAASVLDGTQLVDAVLPYPVATRNPFRLGALIWRLRRQEFTAVVNLTAFRGATALRRDGRFFGLAGISRRYGFQPGELQALRRGADGLAEREAARLLRRVDGGEAVNLDRPEWYRLGVSERDRHEAGARLEAAGIGVKFLALSMGTKASANDWEEHNWRTLLAQLGRSRPGAAVVAIGAADDVARAERCLAEWPGPRLNLCGHTTPRLSAAILARAEVFVGHDSGPMHLAAAVGTRCVAIFSGRNPPGQWFPLGSGHRVLYHRTECAECGLADCLVEHKRCILGIRVAEVGDAVAQVWRMKP